MKANPGDWRRFAEHEGEMHFSIRDGKINVSMFATLDGSRFGKGADLADEEQVEQMIAAMLRGFRITQLKRYGIK